MTRDLRKIRLMAVENCLQCRFGSVGRGGVYCAQLRREMNTYSEPDYNIAAPPP